MTDRPALLTALVIGTALLFAGDSPAPSAEHDGLPARAAAIEAATSRLAENAPQLAKTPVNAGKTTDVLSAPAPQPTLVLPSEPVPVGEFIDISVLAAVPAGVTPTLQWKLNGQPADAKHARIAADGLSAVLTLPPGKHTITVRGAWGVVEGGQVAITFVDLEGLIQVGNGPNPPPDPPKPEPMPPTPTPVVTTPATAAVYVYEKDATPVPVGVTVGLNRLNREKGIRATLFEEDTTDGDGDVPDQYRSALTAAQQQGLPALVVLADKTVLRVVKDPRTVEQVFEAIAP